MVGGKSLSPVGAQRSTWNVDAPGNVQGQSGWGFEQLALEGGVAGHDGGVEWDDL